MEIATGTQRAFPAPRRGRVVMSEVTDPAVALRTATGKDVGLPLERFN